MFEAVQDLAADETCGAGAGDKSVKGFSMARELALYMKMRLIAASFSLGKNQRNRRNTGTRANGLEKGNM